MLIIKKLLQAISDGLKNVFIAHELYWNASEYAWMMSDAIN